MNRTTPTKPQGLLRRLEDRLIRHRLVLAVAAPVVALVAFSLYVVADKLETYRRSTDLIATVQITRAAQALAHEVENERTLSVLYLGTGRQSWASELEEQRQLTDERVEAFRTVLHAPGSLRALGPRQDDIGLGRLAEFREGVNGDASLQRTIERYATLNSALLSVSSKLSVDGISSLVAAYMDLNNMRDRVAQARSIGSTWLLQGRTDPELLQLLANARAEQNAFLQSFRSHATPEALFLYEMNVQPDLLDRLASLHSRALAGRLRANDAENWHRTHLDLMDSLNRAGEGMASELDSRIQSNLTSAQITYYVVIGAVLLLVGFSIETFRRSEKRASVAEEEARRLFRAVEQSPVSVLITDLSGLIQYVNPAFTRMTGYTRDEVLGHNPRVLRSPQTPDSLYRDMWVQISEGQEWRGEIVNQRRDGSIYWEHMTIAPVKGPDGRLDSFIAIKEDVTEVRNLRLALEREHANIRRILEAMNDGVALSDPQGAFQYVNPALLSQFGTIKGKTVGDVLGTVTPPQSESMSRREWRDDESGRVYDVASTWVTNPDTSLNADQTPPQSLLQVFHDITARKQAEEAMNEAREAAELANRAKTEFLATMSHELRTPLNAIIGFSEIIQRELLGPVGTPQYRDYAHDIHESGNHLLQLITDILDVARLDVGRVVLREAVMSPAAIIHSCVAMVSERADSGAIGISVDLPPDLPLLFGDERRVKQVLVNVLGNSVKFTPKGGHVTIRAGSDDKGLFIAISDTGIGIAPEDLAKVMSLFGQADSSMARRYEGSGLGLPLSRKLMDLHGGELSLDSSPGNGTSVTLRFPAERLRAPS